MPPNQQEKPQHRDQEQERQKLNVMIGKHVMSTLGQPGDLHQVQVRHLWGDHYRVNVLVGADAACTKVAHSYFLQVDHDGNIIASSPKITGEY